MCNYISVRVVSVYMRSNYVGVRATPGGMVDKKLILGNKKLKKGGSSKKTKKIVIMVSYRIKAWKKQAEVSG